MNGSNAARSANNKTSKTTWCTRITSVYIGGLGMPYNTTGLAKNMRLFSAASGTGNKWFDGYSASTPSFPNSTPAGNGGSPSYYTQFRLTALTLVAQRVLIGHTDSGMGLYGDPNGWIYPSTGSNGSRTRAGFQSMITIHGNQMPYGFVDGHVGFLLEQQAALGIYNPVAAP